MQRFTYSNHLMRVLYALFVISLLGCAVNAPDTPAPVSRFGETLLKTELYFGLLLADGGEISDSQWQDFLAGTVTPRFKKGFSVMDVRGQWMMDNGEIIKEPSKLLVILHKADARIHQSIEDIRSIYKKRFNQESVLRITTEAAVSY